MQHDRVQGCPRDSRGAQPGEQGTSCACCLHLEQGCSSPGSWEERSEGTGVPGHPVLWAQGPAEELRPWLGRGERPPNISPTMLPPCVTRVAPPGLQGQFNTRSVFERLEL